MNNMPKELTAEQHAMMQQQMQDALLHAEQRRRYTLKEDIKHLFATGQLVVRQCERCEGAGYFEYSGSYCDVCHGTGFEVSSND